MKTLSELPQDPKERVNQLRNEWQTWTDQAVYALIQGQTENEFMAHCHPDNRTAALKAWRQAERLGAKVLRGFHWHIEAKEALTEIAILCEADTDKTDWQDILRRANSALEHLQSAQGKE